MVKSRCNLRYWRFRIIIVLVMLLAAILAYVFRDFIQENIEKFLDWIRQNPYSGPIMMTLVYIVATLLFIPGSILTLGSGWALQQAYERTWLAILVGSLAIWTGAWIGSNMAMLLGRFVFRDSTKKISRKYEIFTAIDKAIE